MAAGKPVVATAYSGNMDFMTPQNSLLVEAEVVRIGEGGAVYPADGHWADPDLDAAAEAMRRVWQDSELGGRIGEQGRRDVSERLAPAAVGEIARDRLERLIGE
jgi:glycosyltransferase involved in cell wall biosynthesis